MSGMEKVNNEIKTQFGNFIKEFNKREWSVRIGKTHNSFEDYILNGYNHLPEYGTGFVVNDNPVPYFHPNRSFHDEIIWLNNNLYYDPDVSFEDKILNSAIVKFYGPSRTLDIITGYASDLLYLTKTDKPYINFNRLRFDPDYEFTLLSNIELASFHKQQLWGTTELRTSLQTSSRNYVREIKTVLDTRDLIDPLTRIKIDFNSRSDRKMRSSDMISWIKLISPDWIKFYSKKPSMKESYEYLTKIRGIGAYYGYHFSSNLARLPGIGSSLLIEQEYSDKFKSLAIEHGNLNEDADYVVAGPGANETLKSLFPRASINNKTSMELILWIKKNQIEFFDITTSDDLKYLSESTEVGRFTTFGIEIACCQFNVFRKLKDDTIKAISRSKAPISKEVNKTQLNLEDMFNV